jgi:hypothetical protein
MGGITRMHDPSELAHDRVRRRVMNIAFAFILLAVGFDLYTFGWNARRAAFIVAWMLASVPLSLFVRLVELRFKMSREELRQVLREIPSRTLALMAVFFVAWIAVVFLIQHALRFLDNSGIAPIAGIGLAWALLGAWLADFFTYFRYRHERLRHIYMVVATLEDIRSFKKEILFPIIALALQSLALVAF